MAGEFQIDALLPADMAAKAEQLGVRKANLEVGQHVRAGGAGGRVHCVGRDFCHHGERGQFFVHGAGCAGRDHARPGRPALCAC